MRHHVKLFMVVLPHNKGSECFQKIKEKKEYHTAEKVTKPNRKFVECGNIPDLYGLSKCYGPYPPLSVENDAIIQVLLHASKLPTLTYNRVNSVIIKNDMTLNIVHNVTLSVAEKTAFDVSFKKIAGP